MSDETALANVSFPSISDEMVNSIALGLEDELVISSRHGFSVEQYLELAQKPWFQAQIAQKRADFEKNGVTFRAKAAWMAGELLDKVYMMASANGASFAQVHDTLKTLIKAGNLEPRDERTVNTAPTFSISIDLGAQSVRIGPATNAQPTPAIDVETKELPQ